MGRVARFPENAPSVKDGEGFLLHTEYDESGELVNATAEYDDGTIIALEIVEEE